MNPDATPGHANVLVGSGGGEAALNMSSRNRPAYELLCAHADMAFESYFDEPASYIRSALSATPIGPNAPSGGDPAARPAAVSAQGVAFARHST